MKTIFADKHFTNADLESALSRQLATGNVVIAHVEPTKNPEWVSVYMVQKRKVESRGSAPSAGLSTVTKILKGFDTSGSSEYILRHIETLNVAALEANKLDCGSVIPGATIGIEDKHEKQTPNQSYIVSKDGEIRTSNGQKIYTHTFLADEANYVGDKVMKFDYVAKAAPVAIRAAELSVKA